MLSLLNILSKISGYVLGGALVVNMLLNDKYPKLKAKEFLTKTLAVFSFILGIRFIVLLFAGKVSMGIVIDIVLVVILHLYLHKKKG